MKKLAALTLLIATLTGCHQTPFMNQAIVPAHPGLGVLNHEQDIVKIVDRHTTVLNKVKVIQQLMKNQITVNKADIFDQEHVYRIEFSNGHVHKVPGFLRLYLRPSGSSGVQLVGNFYHNLPVEFNAQETSAVLKSAENYQAHRSLLDRILDGGLYSEL